MHFRAAAAITPAAAGPQHVAPALFLVLRHQREAALQAATCMPVLAVVTVVLGRVWSRGPRSLTSMVTGSFAVMQQGGVETCSP